MSPLSLRVWLCSLLATGLLVLETQRRLPRAGEPLALRWARTAAAHPFRTAVACALIGFGLARRTRTGARPAAAPGDGDSIDAGRQDR